MILIYLVIAGVVIYYGLLLFMVIRHGMGEGAARFYERREALKDWIA